MSVHIAVGSPPALAVRRILSCADLQDLWPVHAVHVWISYMGDKHCRQEGHGHGQPAVVQLCAACNLALVKLFVT